MRTIKEEADGTLWFGMYDTGIYRLKDGKFTHFTTNDGLFDNGAFQILEDNHDNFWISGNLGIYRVKRTELNDFAEGRTNKVVSVPYNKRDGMLNAECNGGARPAGTRASDGRLWFPTQTGVVVINPESVPVDTTPPPVVIESIVIDTQSSDNYGKPIEIQPDQTYLEIHYSGLSFINPELVKFKYRLEGLDTDWIDAGTRRAAYYTHLPPGKYRFTVLAANRDGIWNTQGANLEITVLPPFWRTWWFLTLSFLILAVIVFLFYRWRIGALKRTHRAKEAFSQQLIESREAFSRQLIESQEAERKRIAGGLHDNLGQHLIIIKNWASLGLKLTSEDAPIRQQFGKISETALKALSEVHEIIYNLRPYQIETVGLNNAIKYMIEQVATSSGINFETHADDLDQLFSPEDEVTFFRIIQESVSNIVKHSKAQNANVTINRLDNSVTIKISDDGDGFTPGNTLAKSDSGNGGFGLTGIAERAGMLGGVFSIQSAPGDGTTILIKISN